MTAGEWPAWATEEVKIAPADPAWQVRGEQERRELDALLAPWRVAGVEHVGSTAVPALPAKPIVDLQAAVADLDLAPQIEQALRPHGWHLVPPDLDQRPWRRLLVKVVDDRRAAHLAVMTLDTPRWHDQLAFRDLLRQNPGLVSAYAALKHALADEHRSDREAYTAAKRAFVEGALAELGSGARRPKR